MFDLEVQRFSRQCAQTGRELQPGETFYSTVSMEGGVLVRRDYSAEAWKGVPSEVLGWWRSSVPDPHSKRLRWAPREVLVDYFQQLEVAADQQDTRYVLALLLLRRRVFRDPHEQLDDRGLPILRLACPSRDATFAVHICPPSADRLQAIQAELSKLLDAGGA